MNDDVLLVIISTLGGGMVTALITAIVTLVRGRAGDKRENKKMRADITDQVTDMAGEWLDRAQKEIVALRNEVDELKRDRERLAQAEARLTEVERENSALREEVETLKTAASAEWIQRQQMIAHVSAVHDWIEGGAKPPPPQRPDWAPRMPSPGRQTSTGGSNA